LYEVEVALRDLPWKTRRDLVADLDSHLDEVSVDSLGSPSAYAAELRESAGLERPHGPIAFLRARRPRNLLIVAVLLVLIALLSSAFAWVESYQPLVHSYGEMEPVAKQLDTETLATFHDGRRFAFGITVHNDGAFAVRIEDVPLIDLQANLPFSGRIMMSGVLKNAGVYPPYVPFRPFDLKPGQDRLLYFDGRYANCRDWGGGAAVEVAFFPVTFGFLWRRETVRLPLEKPLVIQIPVGRRCLT
jgi:hypothetical protein